MPLTINRAMPLTSDQIERIKEIDKEISSINKQMAGFSAVGVASLLTLHPFWLLASGVTVASLDSKKKELQDEKDKILRS
ncbi:MAG: hypothetical protein AAGI91_14785 [Bacteroidota bacterium]